MLDIRTLLLVLGTPEDRYEPTLAIRVAERAVFPTLRQPAVRRPMPGAQQGKQAGPILVP
jgi:hypothetical protein